MCPGAPRRGLTTLPAMLRHGAAATEAKRRGVPLVQERYGVPPHNTIPDTDVLDPERKSAIRDC